MRVNTDRRVYAVFGSDPELTAYAMAKYSRSSLSLRQSLSELNQDRAEKFLNTYYFQYGHRSIADLAHVCLALENISMLAAMEVVDEPKWDGQERSTRYQDFRETGYYIPSNLLSTRHEKIYKAVVEKLFGEYYGFVSKLDRFLRGRLSRPAEMSEAAYDRTLRARAFDSARYLLPLCTVTSVGEIVSARILEEQIARLKSHALDEIRELGDLLKRAASEPAVDVNGASLESLIDSINGRLRKADRRELAKLASRRVRVAPTLIKYSDARPYLTETYKDLEALSRRLLRGIKCERAQNTVELMPEEDPLIETVNTLLYKGSNIPYTQIASLTKSLPEPAKREIVGLAYKHRTRHDDVIRELRVGYAVKFDILMDIGSFRDLQRHRRCVKICQDITTSHGFETPEDIKAAGLLRRYKATMGRVLKAFNLIAQDFPESAKYILPMGFRRRALFKMDFAEAQYVCELRTAPQGHFSYQAVAYNMYLRLQEKWPELAKNIKVHESWFEQDKLHR